MKREELEKIPASAGAEDFPGYRPNYLVDLHTHSTRSDGADTPQQLIDHAAALGMKVIAITDHDIRPPGEIRVAAAAAEKGTPGEKTDEGESVLVDAVDYARSKGLQLLRGIEISCETTAEDCHLVCLGCDWEVPFFDSLEQAVVESKIGSYRELVRRLDADGMHMTWEEVLENGGDEAVAVSVRDAFVVKPEYLQSALDVITAEFGDVEHYLTQGLGLSRDLLGRFRERMLEYAAKLNHAYFSGDFVSTDPVWTEDPAFRLWTEIREKDSMARYLTELPGSFENARSALRLALPVMNGGR